MNALNDPKVGKFLNEHFVSAFQKVGTFRIVGKQKQGGNVASYFCAQDGRVLHVVAGPVNADTLLREAKWVVEKVRSSLAAAGKGKSFKAEFRKAHAERLRAEHGLKMKAVTYDTPAPGEKTALSYADPTGKHLAPVLDAPPIDGPDVSFEGKLEPAAQDAVGRNLVVDRRGRRWALGNQGQVHQLLAAHSMKNIETIYGTVFERILGERISTKPVIVAHPFPWCGTPSPRTPGLKIQQPIVR